MFSQIKCKLLVIVQKKLRKLPAIFIVVSMVVFVCLFHSFNRKKKRVNAGRIETTFKHCRYYSDSREFNVHVVILFVV